MKHLTALLSCLLSIDQSIGFQTIIGRLDFHLQRKPNYNEVKIRTQCDVSSVKDCNEESSKQNDNNHDNNSSSSAEIITTTKPKKYNQQLGTFEKLTNLNDRSERIVKLYDFSDEDPINYVKMWDIQKEIVDGHVQRLKVEFQKKVPESQFWTMDDVNIPITGNDESIDAHLPHVHIGHNDCKNKEFDYIHPEERRIGRDAIIFLSHKPVYTLGTASDENFIKTLDDEIDVVRIERGGEVTYHGTCGSLVSPDEENTIVLCFLFWLAKNIGFFLWDVF